MWGVVLRIQELVRSIGASLDGLVHDGAAHDPLLMARHRSFIGSHLVGGLAALVLLPIAVLAGGSSAVFTVVALSLVGLQVLAAAYVSRSGQLVVGHLLSATSMSVLVFWVTLWTGGLSSFALLWLAVIPVEAALCGERKAIVGSALIGALGLAGAAMVSFGVVASPAAALADSHDLVAAGTCLFAIGYTALVAIRIQHVGKASETRWRQGETRYRLLASASDDIVTCHLANGDVAYASPAAGRLLGVMSSELHGEGLFRRVHVGDRPAYLNALSDTLHEGHADIEFRLRRTEDGNHADGFVWVEASMRKLSAETAVGEERVSVVIRDIAGRKQQEAELIHARAAAEEASVAKTRILANVSHELRTPLNAIIGFSDLLGQEIFGPLPDDRQKEYVRLIHEAGEHLLQVVNDILDMAKIEAGNFDVLAEPIEVAPLLDRCLQLMQRQAETNGLNLRTDVEPNLPELVADQRALRQILLNLLSNSVKFTDAGGEIVCGAKRTGRSIALFVRDDGIGIAPADLPRLGTPFVQADTGYNRRHEGTGLGLSVVKGLVALHGGSLKIDSELGMGTTVTVTLPCRGDSDAPTRLRPALTGDAAPAARLAKRA
ncbi:Histidine protein kinase DivJ [Hartmannibacter diazotrophicus]|uniref:histidine kinase n=2 Tax=Hartmannibacter diazotrophicus TaxID=1482074 RepID=A0A2C9D3Q9_9HYPH|nr:Histidine protein kinase DivJ [Hartmannibacter diazotrophicus]